MLEHVTMFRSVRPIFQPTSIAIVGASESAAGWSKPIYDSMKAFAPGMPVYPINPKRDTVWGERCYHSFADLPDAPDLALMITPAKTIPGALREGVARGLQGATVYAAGFGEGHDPEGAAISAQIAELCAGGLRLNGPNCMGTLSLYEKLYLFPSPRMRDVVAGDVGLVFQSGGLFQFWLANATNRGLGFTYCASVGNELDLDIADYINFFVDDEKTKVIVALSEGIKRPEAFMVAAGRALAARKPILMVKIGRSEAAQAATQSHTGTLAGDDRVFDAVCERYGIIRCNSIDDLTEYALAFRSGRIPNGKRVAIVGYSGAARGLIFDEVVVEKIELTDVLPETTEALREWMEPGTIVQNPMDFGGLAARDPGSYQTICQIVAKDPNVDLLAVQAQLPQPGESPNPNFIAGIVASTDKPVFAYSRTAQNVLENGREFQKQAGMAFVQGIPTMVRVAKQLVRYGDRVKRGLERVPAGRSTPLGGSFEDALRKNGVPGPAAEVALSADDAVRIAARIGFPVAIKLHSLQPLHKTELGGVILDVRDVDAAVKAARELFATIAAHPELGCDGVLVQEMVSGVEMIVGVRDDPGFGPVVVLGLGGIFVEAFDDVALRLLPVDAAEIREMIASLRGRRLLEAFRGRPARDVDALVGAVETVSRLFLEHRSSLLDVEINPLVVLDNGRGIRAVDVRTVSRNEA